jgi:hypothetical protein
MELYDVYCADKAANIWFVQLANGTIAFANKTEAERFANKFRSIAINRAESGAREYQLGWIEPGKDKAEPEAKPTICFVPGNNIQFMQDMRFFQGVPADIDFNFTVSAGGWMELTAPGYGHPGDYGDGSILVSFGNFDSILRYCQDSLDEVAYRAAIAKAKAKIRNAIEDL